MAKLPQYIVIAKDQHGAPRAWGAATTALEAREECEKQVSAYQQERPDIQLSIQPAVLR